MSRDIKRLFNITIGDVKKISDKISGLVKKTPLEYNPRLSKRYNAEVYIKREDLQLPRSFKIRGAYNKILNVVEEGSKKEVVCASAGNHAQGVALSCSHLNVPCTIYIPEKTPLQKINRIKHFGDEKCTIKLCGDDFNDCLNQAVGYSNKNDLIFVHPFNDYDVIMGQSTVAYEIFNEIQPDYIVSCIGGGGLISGISLYINKM